MKKELQRNLSFVFFVMAVFFAGMALTVFQEYIWVTCIAGVLLLAASVFYAMSRKEEAVSQTEKTTELLLADRMADLMRGNEKAEKGVYIAVKKQHEAMESGIASLEEKIAELVRAQEQAVKTLVMYNKENAKQMALSEREELGRLREELKLLQQEGGSMSPVVDAVREMSSRLYEEMHESSEAILAELGTTVDTLEEIKAIAGSRNTGVPMEELTEFFEPEEVPESEEVPVAEEKPEDAFASSGVDLSDPNKTLSADDIAALFAAMGN